MKAGGTSSESLCLLCGSRRGGLWGSGVGDFPTLEKVCPGHPPWWQQWCPQTPVGQWAVMVHARGWDAGSSSTQRFSHQLSNTALLTQECTKLTTCIISNKGTGTGPSLLLRAQWPTATMPVLYDHPCWAPGHPHQPCSHTAADWGWFVTSCAWKYTLKVQLQTGQKCSELSWCWLKAVWEQTHLEGCWNGFRWGMVRSTFKHWDLVT